VSNASDDDQALVVVNGIHDAIVADSNPVIVAPGERDGSGRSGVVGEAVDRGRDAVAQGMMKTPIRARRLRVEADFVAVAERRAYVRTSDHGTVEARASRA
jgi:hypothetical protein